MSEISKEERNREYQRAYYEKNKDKIAKQRKAYRQQNREKIAKQKRVYSAKNKEHKKAYYQSEQGKKSGRISKWKRTGIISEDYDALYDKVFNTSHCEECGVKLTVDKKMTSTTRCCDHDHATGLFRNVLCHSCNVKRG